MENENQKKGIDLVVFLREIWNKRSFIIKCTCVGFILGILVAYSIPQKFQAEVKLMINEIQFQPSSQGLSMANLLGMNMTDMSTISIAKEIYPEVVKSTELLSGLASLKVSLVGDGMTLYDYITKYQKEPWWNKVINFPKTIKGWLGGTKESETDIVWSNSNLSSSQQKFIAYLRENIQLETNTNNDMVLIRVVTQNAAIAAEIANTVAQKFEDRISEIQKVKLEQQLNMAQKIFRNSEIRYEEMLKRNEMESNKSKTMAYSPVKLDVAFNLYNMIAQQYEILKVDAESPEVLFEVIQPAVSSDIAIAPHRKKIIIGLTFVFGFLALFWSLFKQAWVIDYKK